MWVGGGVAVCQIDIYTHTLSHTLIGRRESSERRVMSVSFLGLPFGCTPRRKQRTGAKQERKE